MANNIDLFSQYIPVLDEVYKLNSLTSVLDGANDVAARGANANELIIPKMDMSGMAKYDRNTGYAPGDVNSTNQTVSCNYDRGRMFMVDTLDNAETAGIAFGKLAGEFIRTQVVPELDAFRLCTYANFPGVNSTVGALTTGAQVIGALRAAANALDENEVAAEGRSLFITPTLIGLVEDMDTIASRAVLSRFGRIIRVPVNRLNKQVTLVDAGGWTATGAAINFIAIHDPAIIHYQKHIAPKVITPQQNQNADAWKFGYRNVGIATVYENKVKGIFVHSAA